MTSYSPGSFRFAFLNRSGRTAVGNGLQPEERRVLARRVLDGLLNLPHGEACPTLTTWDRCMSLRCRRKPCNAVPEAAGWLTKRG